MVMLFVWKEGLQLGKGVSILSTMIHNGSIMKYMYDASKIPPYWTPDDIRPLQKFFQAR